MKLHEEISRMKSIMNITENHDSKKYYVDNSDLGGKGVFASKNLKKGETIGLLHDIIKMGSDYNFTELGEMHNHKDEPNCHNDKRDNQRYLVASRDIEKGEELTTDYRLQPDLEQPQSLFSGLNEQKFVPQIDGYRTYSPFKEMDYIIVDSNGIDCDNIVWDLVLVGNGKEIKFCKKNSGAVFFKKSNKVVELPLMDGEEVEDIFFNEDSLKDWIEKKLKKVDKNGEIKKNFF